jgi:hypothetical protein
LDRERARPSAVAVVTRPFSSEIFGLLIELLRHRSQDQAKAFVKLAVRKVATMFGAKPKLKWKRLHENQTHIC